MMAESGLLLLQSVAERIIARYLEETGHSEVVILGGRPGGEPGAGVDITYRYHGRRQRVKVKPDSYFGTDPTKVNDRRLAFYRGDAGHYAFESISNSMTREPGWIFNSDADEIYYYYLALVQSEEEVGALLGEPDDVFFGELQVERDELRILPMDATRAWFETHYEEYTPRPVNVGDHSAWYRLIPRTDIDSNLAGLRTAQDIFSRVSL